MAAKIFPTLKIEQSLWNKGLKFICGLDEVGRGCFAGPVVVGAVVFPQNVVLPQGIADSKTVTPFNHGKLSDQIKKVAIFWSVGEVNVPIINKIGIDKATQVAFRQAVSALSCKPDYLLIDAFYIQGLSRDNQKAVEEGDSICASISAASIIAKVYRDDLMKEYDKKFPDYGFAKHKGYGTKAHQEAIGRFGLCKFHRKSFNLNKFLT